MPNTQEHLHYEIAGNASQPTMLLVHGFLTSNVQWILNREALSRRFHLVMVEIWGHGRSPSPTDPDAYTAARYTRELENIRKTLGIDRWAVVGQSYGAAIVIQYALRCPDHVTSIVFTNSVTALGQSDNESRRNAIEEGFQDLRAFPQHPINVRRLSADIKEQLVRAADSVNPQACLLGAQNSTTLSCRQELNQLHHPVLLCNGIYEKAFQPCVTHVRQTCPGINIENLKAGHSPNLEAASAFNDAVLQFCRASA